MTGLDSWQGQRTFFPSITAPRPALDSTQPAITCVQGTVFPKVKRPGREDNNSPPSSVEVKNAWSYTSTPTYVFMTWYLS